jgi:hypothetical protein
MFAISDATLAAYKSQARNLTGYVSIRSTKTGTTTQLLPNRELVKFTIEKTSPTGKLFGFAVSQKITIEITGTTTAQKGFLIIPVIYPKDRSEYELTLPYFYVDTVEFNKVKNITTIVGYDYLHKLDSIAISKVAIVYPTTAQAYAEAVLRAAGGGAIDGFEGINHTINEAPNVSPTASCREVLAALAEFTGSICYVTYGNMIRFRAMESETVADTITPADYFDLTVGSEYVQLSLIGNINEFDSDVYYYGTAGFSQIFRENPFMYRDDAGAIVNAIGAKVIGVHLLQYNLQWRGCPAYELGDYLALQDKNGGTYYIRLLNETWTFDGGLRANSEWIETESESMDLAPKGVSSTIKNTMAKVDKINSEISLVVETVNSYDVKIEEIEGTVKTYDERISEIEVNTEGIELVVKSNEETIQRVDDLQYNVEELSKEVALAVTEDEVSIMLQQEVANNGVTSVTTTTGYTFGRDGLRINKSGTTLETTITEDGMRVTDAGEERLTANSEGVTANKFTANTYLSIQGNIIFTEYGSDRMGCFWIKEG